MSNCITCFTTVDMRSAKHCATCNGVLHKDCAINDGGTFYCDTCYTVKQEEGEKVDVKIPDVIRRSHIEVYRSCPFKFLHEVIKGIEQPKNIYSQLGIDLHALFDKLNKKPSYSKKQMTDDFKSCWEKYPDEIFNGVCKDKMYKRAIDSIDTAYSIIPSMGEPFASEETIEFSVGKNLPKVSTTADRVDEIGDELEIHDWKTGTVMIGKKLSTDIQAPLYIYGVQDKYKRPVRRFTFHYFSENKQRVFERVANDIYKCTVGKRDYVFNITDAIKEVQRVFSKIQQGHFNIPSDTRKMYYTCKVCHLREMEICQGADIESWKQYNKKGRGY